MAKKKKEPAARSNQPKTAATRTTPVPVRNNSGEKKDNSKQASSKMSVTIVALIIISIITWFTWENALENKFTNWDDLGYVLTNPLIKNSSIEGLKHLFDLSSRVMGNYHPLTIVTYWYEYGKHGLEPYYYHLDSILLHLGTTMTAFLFARVLTKSVLAAFIAALLFAIHPMRVESVTWIAGRKDILYGAFYLLACTTHILYIRSTATKRTFYFSATIVLFFLSLMCKSVGVTLPVVLLLLDYYEHRELKVKLLLEKLPLFALAFTFGWLSIIAQKDVGALGTLDVKFSVLERLALGCSSLCTYIWKTIVPVKLTNFYPYPIKGNGGLPAVLYIYPVIVFAGAFLLWKYGRKNRMLIFGTLFFVINLLLLLQFIPVGGAVMSDRYTYIPYTGLFILAGWVLSNGYNNKQKWALPAIALTLAASGAYAYMTNERNKDWYDSVTLWNDAIEKNPESPIGYFYLGQEYYTRFEAATNQTERKKYGDSALHYFNQSVARKPDYTNPIICIGEYQRSTGFIDDAKATYYKALAINDKLESAYLGLGVVYSIKQEYDSAAPMFRKALSLKEYFPEGHSNYANFLEITGKTDSSLIEYAFAISQNPDAYIPYMNRGRIYMKLQQYDKAIADYSIAILLKPENPDPVFMRAQCYAAKGNKTEARKDADAAKRMGALIDPMFYESLN